MRIVEGQTDKLDDVIEVLHGHRQVISCLSSFEPPHNSMSLLTENIVTAAERMDSPDIRFIAYSLCGVEPDGDRLSHAIQSTLRVFSPGKFGPAINDHKEVIGILSKSQLNYTLFQTATMVNKRQGENYVSGSPSRCPGARLWHRWGVLDAADVCLSALAQSELRRLQMRYVPGESVENSL